MEPVSTKTRGKESWAFREASVPGPSSWLRSDCLLSLVFPLGVSVPLLFFLLKRMLVLLGEGTPS